jgi:hypothetical protein
MNRIFLFNSGLPEANQSQEDFLQSLGPSYSGFWGRNIGNGYIGYAVLKTIFGEARKVDHVANVWEAPLTERLAAHVNETNSHLIFCMQDFVREHARVLPFERVTGFLEKIKIPIVPVSLGANSFMGYDADLPNLLSREQKRFLQVVSDRSELIGVRGVYTAETLGRLGIKNVKILGCPTFFESGSQRLVRAKEWNSQKVVTTGGFFHPQAPLSRHVLQDELYFIERLFLAEEGPFRDRFVGPLDPKRLGCSFQLWQKAKAGLLEFFPDFQKWEEFYVKNDFCLTIGSRLHSGIFAINRGTPAIITNEDARARETSEYLGIPYLPRFGRRDDLKSAFEQINISALNARYPQVYENYRQFMNSYGIQLCPQGAGAREESNQDLQCFEFPDFGNPGLNGRRIHRMHEDLRRHLFSVLVDYSRLKMSKVVKPTRAPFGPSRRLKFGEVCK